jgi:hypothetical protein
VGQVEAGVEVADGGTVVGDDTAPCGVEAAAGVDAAGGVPDVFAVPDEAGVEDVPGGEVVSARASAAGVLEGAVDGVEVAGTAVATSGVGVGCIAEVGVGVGISDGSIRTLLPAGVADRAASSFCAAAMMS